MLSRRTVLKSLIGIPVLLGGGYVLVRPKYATVVQRAVFKKLHYLKMDTSGVEEFAIDFIGLYKKTTAKVISIDVATRLSEQFASQDVITDRVAVFEGFVARKYLLSSDFFVNNQNEDRTIFYRDISYTDPYQRPCSNPFATFS